MRFLLVGGEDRVGRAVCLEALNRGHAVTVLTRSEQAVPIGDAGVRFVVGDPADVGLLASLATGASAIGALGPGASTPSPELAGSLVAAAGRAGVTRLVLATGPPTGRGWEAALEGASFLDWTVLVHPAVLREGARTGRLRYTERRPGTGMVPGGGISYPDLAVAFVDLLEVPRHRGKWVVVEP
jgi:putative NADH-flavin reductase